MNSSANNFFKFYNLIMAGRQVVLYPSWLHVLITKLFQAPHNCVLPTVKKRTFKGLTYDLHQFIYNFKPHASLQRFDWCIADTVLQLLKPDVNCRSENMESISENAEHSQQPFLKKMLSEPFWVTLQFEWTLIPASARYICKLAEVNNALHFQM